MKNLLTLLAFMAVLPLFSQTSNSSTLKIFLNCNYCDQDYIKQNLEMVEFVRDRQFADVDLLFRNQRNGSGGRTYEIEFIGQGEFKDIKNLSIFNTNPDNTQDDIRAMRMKHIKLGLVPFWVKNGDEDKINVNIKKTEASEVVEEEEKDPWNYWVFNLGVGGYFSGQETYESSSYDFSVQAKRVTDKNKFFFRAGIDENRSVYKFGGEEIISRVTFKSVYMSDVISINDHWSAGAFLRFGENSYGNYTFYSDFKPGIEYNFFDYKESSKKQLTLSYKVGILKNKYIERTIFGEDDELLWEQELTLGGSIVKSWGNVSGEVSYESYLHDMGLDAFSFRLGGNFRIVKGLSFNVFGRYGIDNNQINIAAGDISLEELLLSQQQVSSGYSYSFNLGVRYSFGSLYNTIVNPRFNF